ncbi:glutathione s transferase d10 isoform a-related [Holotrichia oblita]|uniref:Glutathione s transferase d10 isoform a-related n=1 Tax=Holotrichia oblita TaxID=644536 RepID=A0ACB9SXY8_HOLOL|nr:glutathione s transferase d10 isoform a-related [Holotrichia oblita]
MPLTLYYLTDGPPSVACRMLLKAMKIDCNLVKMDFLKGDHLTEEYAKKNPQKEIPVLDDDGFYLSERNKYVPTGAGLFKYKCFSTAILQYLADKYGKNDTFYPKDIKARAIVNHRLAFSATKYYRYIEDYLLPLFYDYERTELMLKKVHVALAVFNTYLERLGTKYSAGGKVK